MAIINCPECGKEVSEKAESCPNCGYSIIKYFEEKKAVESINQERKRLQEELDKELDKIDKLQKPEKPTLSSVILSGNRWIWILCFICFLLIIFALIYIFSISGKFEWPYLIPAIILLILVLVGGSDIREKYQEKLTQYNDFDGYKEQQKQRTRENYKYKIQYVEKYSGKSETSKPTVPSFGLRCPVCGSASVRRISTTSRVTSVAMVGLASSKIGKQYECKNCKHKW